MLGKKLSDLFAAPRLVSPRLIRIAHSLAPRIGHRGAASDGSLAFTAQLLGSLKGGDNHGIDASSRCGIGCAPRAFT